MFSDPLKRVSTFSIDYKFNKFQLFLLSNQRERNVGKKCLQNNPNKASDRNAEKLLTKNIPNRASAMRTSEL